MHLTYEKLLFEAEKEGIEVLDHYCIGRFKGLYIENTISINEKIKNKIEKKCILCEELGHYHTSYGNIINQSEIENRQQERKARAWAYTRLVNFSRLIEAYQEGICNRYELAEFLGVTEKFLIDAIKYYKEKYGICYKYKNYVIYFEPLGVLENYERG